MLAKQTKQNHETNRTQNDAILEELVKKARKGKKDELYLLCENLAKSVLFRTTRFMGGSIDAEDVSQEVLIKVCENIGNLRDPKAFKGWLNRIIINEIRRHAKKDGRDDMTIGIEEIEILEEKDEMLLPHVFAEKEELRSTIVKYIDRLPYRQREAVMMHYFDGLSVTETAKAMGLVQPIVSKYLALARKKLKNDMENDKKVKEVLNPYMSAVAILPISEVMANTLQIESAAFLPTNSEWKTQTLVRCGEYLSIGEGAGTGAATTAMAVTSNTSIGVGGVVLGCLVACIAAATIVFIAIPIERPEQEVPPPIVARGEIVFDGGIDSGDGIIYINPEHAKTIVTSTGGDVKAYNWYIIEPKSGEILYMGDGLEIGDVLKRMRQEDRRYGEYKLYYSFKDESGAIITIGRNFYIRRD